MPSIKTDSLLVRSLNNKEAIGKTIHRHINKQNPEILLIEVGILLLKSHNYSLGYIYLIFRL